MKEMQVQNLHGITGDAGDLGSTPGSGRSLEEGTATHSRILAWEIPWTEEPDSLQFSSVQFSSVQLLSCFWLCDPMDCSTPGLPVHHQLPEFTQTHVYWVGNAIQPSHPLSSPSPPAFNLLQHQDLLNESVLCIRWPKYWLQFKGWHQVGHDLVTKHSCLPDKLAIIVFLTI